MAHSKAVPKFGSDQEVVVNLNEALKEMPRNMLIFSTILRALYVDKFVGTNDQAAVKTFRKLRDDTRNDAYAYSTVVLPLCKQLVFDLQDFFKYHSHLSFEQWFENLPEIVDKVHGYRQQCEAVIEMHEDIMISLKKREDQAKMVLTELKGQQAAYGQHQKELEAWASSNNEETAYAVEHWLMPAIKQFSEGLKHGAGFFALMKNELGQIAHKAKLSIDKDRPVKLHYTMIDEKAKTIITDCRGFMFALPFVRSDFEAILN